MELGDPISISTNNLAIQSYIGAMLISLSQTGGGLKKDATMARWS